MRATFLLSFCLACVEKQSGGEPATTDTGSAAEVDTETPTETDSPTEHDSGTTTETCGNVVSAVFPADGEPSAFYRSTVSFTLVVTEPGAAIAVAGPSGENVAGSTTVEGTRIVWTADAPLSPDTAYTATLTWSCPDLTTSFTTSSTGTAVSATDLAGKVYALRLVEGMVVEPPGLGYLIEALSGGNGALVEVTSATELELTLRGASGSAADAEAQDECVETIAFPDAATFDENPWFQVGSPSAVLTVLDTSFAIDDLAFTGAFNPTGDAIEGGTMSGNFDTRPFVPLFTKGAGDSGICDLVAGFGIYCVECASGEGPYCLAIEIQDLTATQVTTDIVPITPADVTANPSCP